ncbi:hypothetical protein ACWGJB_39485 [Streptomyces sp. NPDC054813]
MDDALYVEGDLWDDRSVREAVGAALETLGGLDVLVNNARSGRRAWWRTTPTNGSRSST